VHAPVDGRVEPGWEPVREAFAANFAEGGEVGAGVAVFHRGRCVVDLVGGWFDADRSAPYTHDTLQVVFSTTKGVVATAVAMCVDRGLIAYADPVAELWPEFADCGKESITIAQVLSHRAGLYTTTAAPSLADALHWDTITRMLAESTPQFVPGSTHGYHAITFGWLAGEIVRRADGRSIGRFVGEEIAGPLGGEIYIGLPERLEHRVSPLIAGPRDTSSDTPGGAARAVPPADSPLGRALTVEGSLAVRGGFNRRDLHAAEIPGANGISNAHSLAAMYAATLGEVNGVQLVSRDTRVAAATPATPEGERDAILTFRTRFGMGYMTPCHVVPWSAEGSFGHPGAGGSMAFADPSRELAVAYVMNEMGTALMGDPRAARLAAAATSAAESA